MHIASRKPTPSTRLSEETRLMWEMDELNYTTYASAPKTTVVTDVEEKKKEESSIISVIQLTLPSETPTTTAAPRKSFYSTHTLSTWKLTESPPTTSTTPAPITRVLWIANGVQTEEEKAFEKQQMVIQEVHREKSTLEQLSDEVPTAAAPPPKVTTTSRPRPVKHGFDRSLDEAIDAGIISYPSEDFTSQREYGDDGNFQFQLSTFSSSATCIARTMFDLWCVCQLMTLFPYLIGVCVARRSLFVSHLVLDILLLVIGFVYTITMIVFSIVLYVLIGEMPKETLFEWILFALVLGMCEGEVIGAENILAVLTLCTVTGEAEICRGCDNKAKNRERSVYDK
ncbi:hypothetical protein ANCCEY_09609 [Ancylostoma ceylanicum]|uniref:Uncharacterized protein n=1 Tax=Ancylostoma ceylanicum TaxID=53326 RepID=A0A0D6LGW8_9BILA|nr:hypothetical protein ANCCEY_09609 [Ancylostoma ceylanicum]